MGKIGTAGGGDDSEEAEVKNNGPTISAMAFTSSNYRFKGIQCFMLPHLSHGNFHFFFQKLFNSNARVI